MRCEAIAKCSGGQCRLFARRGTEFCMHHTPGHDTTAAARKAGLASGKARRRLTADEMINASFSFADRSSIQAFIETMVRLIAAGRISRSQGYLILRACSLAMRNFDKPAPNTNLPAVHKVATYFPQVYGLLKSIDYLVPPGARLESEGEEEDEE